MILSEGRYAWRTLKVTLLLAAILPIVVGLRLQTLVYPTQEWGADEGLFLVMARDLLHGHLPYTLTFDNKPPGLYLIYAAALTVFGGSAGAVYLAASVSIWLGAIAMFALVHRATSNRTDIGLLAAFAFAAFLCQARALGAKEELFFVPLDIAALSLVWPTGKTAMPAYRPFCAGLIMGFAICVKPFALADLLTVLIAVSSSGRRPWRHLLSVLVAVPIVPALLALPYVLSGQVQLLYDTQIRANLARAALREAAAGILRLVMSQFLTLFPLVELLLLAPLYLWRAPAEDNVLKRSVCLSLLWVCIDLLFIFRVGRIRPHLFLQVEAPLVVIGSIVLWRGTELITRGRFLAVRTGARVALVAALAIALLSKPLQRSFITARAYSLHGPSIIDDQATIIADRLANSAGKDVFFITVFAEMEYFLTGRRSPTRYGYIWFLADPQLETLSADDPRRELAKIFEHPPSFVLTEPELLESGLDPEFLRIVNQKLRCGYRVPEQLPGGVLLYRRIDSKSFSKRCNRQPTR